MTRAASTESSPSPATNWSLPTSLTAEDRGRFVSTGRPLPCCPEGTSENGPARFPRCLKRVRDPAARIPAKKLYRASTGALQT